MPVRTSTFVKDGIYHIFNKTIDNRKIFLDPEYSEKFLDTVRFYKKDISLNLKYSKFLRHSAKNKTISLTFADNVLEIYAFCLMPNHFHFLVKQTSSIEVGRIIARITDSFARYFNIKSDRKGPLFLPQFKSKTIASEEQFIHVARYIHLNPYSSKIVTSCEDLRNYPYSSYYQYLNRTDDVLLDTDFYIKYYSLDRNNEKLIHSTEANAEWQKSLEKHKHMK